MQLTVIAGTEAGLHLISRSPAQVLLEDRTVVALSRDPGGWWLVLDGAELWRASNQDGSPTDPRPVATADGFRLTCVAGDARRALLGTARAHLLTADLGDDVPALAPVESFEQAPGRSAWYTPWGGPPDVRSVAGLGGAVYVNVHVGGILASGDDLRAWKPTIDIDADVHQVIAGVRTEDPRRYVLAAAAHGLHESWDDAGTWTLSARSLHAPYCRAVAVGEHHVFVTASTGPRGGRAAMYRRPLLDPEAPFERCAGGLPEYFADNIDTACLAAEGPDVAVGTGDGEVYASGDEGSSWELIGRGLPPVRCVGLAVSSGTTRWSPPHAAGPA
jgi:hypothetical protein